MTVDDAQLLREWRNAPHVALGMLSKHRISSREHARWLRRILASEDCRYWVIYADGRPAGLAHLSAIDLARKSCSWGFYVGELALRGRGIASAALAAVLDHAFEALDLKQVHTEVLASNRASLAVHRKLGFQVTADPTTEVLAVTLRREDWRRHRRLQEPSAAQRWTVKLEG